MNTTEFARLLGITQGQVSRYESGKAVPGAVPLGRLMYLAEGIEKNLIVDHLAIRLGNPDEPNAKEALAELERLVGQEHFPKGAPDALALPPNLSDLLNGVEELCAKGREVSSSLARFVRLWLESVDTDPLVHQCFFDAAQYLEFLLRTKTRRDEPETPEQGIATTRRKLA